MANRHVCDRLKALAAGLLLLLGVTGCGAPPSSGSASPAEPKVVLVTFDGARWEEVFRGADPAFVETLVHPDLREGAQAAYVAPENRPAALMPFLHTVIARDGVLLGDRDRGECAKTLNDMWFSYPGYSELLAGKPNADIKENDPILNKDVTVLEWANRSPVLAGKVDMVGTWTLFPFIVNAERSGVPVNAAFEGKHPTDVLTARAGLQLLQQKKPRLLYIAFGDTDEYAHLGDYHAYLAALERGDEYLRQIWEILQADPFYRGQTTLIVTTDHGRGGDAVRWKDHSSPRYHALWPDYQPEYNGIGVPGADDIWIAAMGPAVDRGKAQGYDDSRCARQAQVAKSVVVALGAEASAFSADAAEPFAFMMKPAP